MSSIAAILFFVCISLGCLVLSRVVYSSFINPVAFYILPWAICTCLAASGACGIYQPQSTTVLIIAISLPAFAVPCFVLHGLRMKGFAGRVSEKLEKKDTKEGQSEGLAPVRRKVFICLEIAAVLVAVYFVNRTLPYLLDGFDLTYIKFQYSNAEGSTLFTTRELLLLQWIVKPVFSAAIVVLMCGIVEGHFDWVAFVFAVLGTLLIVGVSGGRNMLFEFFCLACVAVLISPMARSLLDRIRLIPRSIKLLAILLVVAMVAITQMRSLSEDSSVLENVFFYFAGPITYFDQILQSPSSFGLFQDYLYGRATFGFIVNPLHILASMVFGFDYVGSDTVISNAASVYLPFSDQITGNAVCTALFAFMYDFGYAGIVLGPMLFGLIVAFVWEKAFEDGKPALPWFPVCVYVMFCVLFSEWRYQLVFPAVGMTALILLVLFARKIPTRRTAGARHV